MNRILDKLERKLGKYTIRNISLVLIMCYVAGYVLMAAKPGIFAYLTLNPYYILKGQIWRLVTWLIIPPESLDVFTVLMLYCYYSIGRAVENAWGTFRYNCYLFSGMLFTIIGAFGLYAFYCFEPGYAEMISIAGKDVIFESYMMQGVFAAFSTVYVNMSIFLAFAFTYPDSRMLFMMVIPIRAKVLGIAYVIVLGYSFVTGGTVSRIIIGASLLNFVIFFLGTRDYWRISPKQALRRREFEKKMKEAMNISRDSTRTGVITRHKCAICGRTEHDDENLEFRFCSKCEGNYEYCSDHLYTHEHVHKK